MPLAEDLSQLSKMRSSGELTEEQFQQAKKYVLEEYGATITADKPVGGGPSAASIKRGKRRFLGLGIRGWVVTVALVLIATSVSNYQSPADRREALRQKDPVAYAALVAKEKVEAEKKAEADRQRAAEEQKRLAVAAEQKAARQAKEAQEEAANREAGFHCLSPWDGSHPDLIEWVKKKLNDPDSFQHDETKVTPVNDKGEHSILMDYRAKNGFGGVVRGSVLATFRNSDCALVAIVSSN